MNKDEAERCIELGLSALKLGDKDKAIRMFQKSDSLFSNELAKKYLKIASEQPQITKKSEEKIKQQPAKPSAPQYKPEQETMCRQILQKTDYYDILSLQKTANQDEIKKSYRKLALRLHPDKNFAPSASEAFKKINKAFACLSDEVKRRTYDQTGQEEVHGIDNRPFNNGDFAEHIFREFFNESFFFPSQGFQRTYRTQSQHSSNENRAQAGQGGNVRMPLMQLLPILVLIFVSLASNLQGSSEVYSFHYSSTYSIRKNTENLRVEYFLTPSFASDLTQSEKSRLEKTIESTYLSYMQHECEVQKRKKNNLLNKAKYYKGASAQNYKDYAEAVDLSTCSKLQKLMQK